MRISDVSSDVCSSDLWEGLPAAASPFHTRPARAAGREKRSFPMAIDDLLDEHEQSERVLAWLRSNGAGLIGGVILGLALIIGWQWWGSRQASADMQRSEEHTSELQSLMRISYAVFCFKKKQH